MRLLALFCSIAVVAACAGETLPEGPNGLAAKYPGDVGIEKDPDIVFTENFESPSIDDVCKRWEDIKDKENLSFFKTARPAAPELNACCKPTQAARAPVELSTAVCFPATISCSRASM